VSELWAKGYFNAKEKKKLYSDRQPGQGGAVHKKEPGGKGIIIRCRTCDTVLLENVRGNGGMRN